jgi:hypothetical protein
MVQCLVQRGEVSTPASARMHDEDGSRSQIPDGSHGPVRVARGEQGGPCLAEWARMRIRSVSTLGLVALLAVSCGSSQPSGGQGGSAGQGTGGAGTGGVGTGGTGTGGDGTGGNGGHGGASTGGHGGHGGASTGGHGGHGGAATGGNSGRGGAGGANGGPCWSATDCGSATCAPLGTLVCGGACIAVQHACTSDTDCAADAAAPTVCQQIPCSCPSGMGCAPGCTADSNCPEGQSCASNHHCFPTTCTLSSDACPANFSCSPGSGVCARKVCQTDSQCSGSCVEGNCYAAPGTCRPPVP